jgi:hypothetical protein
MNCVNVSIGGVRFAIRTISKRGDIHESINPMRSWSSGWYGCAVRC